MARDERNETTSYGEDRSSEVTSERSSVQITSVVPFLVHLLTTSLLLSLLTSSLLLPILTPSHLRPAGTGLWPDETGWMGEGNERR